MGMGEIISLIIQISTLIGIIGGGIVCIIKIFRGQKCLLRTEMLRIYYRNKSERALRQFEYENFVLLYEAYKGLRGNNFIDKVYKEIQEWTLLP